MKRNRIFFVVTAFILTFALAAMAQAPGRMGRQGARGPAEQGVGQAPFGGPQFLVKYLELTEAQIVNWRTFQEEARAAAAPLAEQRRNNGEQIREALLSGNANPTTIGELMIANHQIGGQIQAIHEAAQVKLVGILTPEQKVKFDKYLELRKSMPRRGPGGQGFGGAGMGSGHGFGPGTGSCAWCED